MSRPIPNAKLESGALQAVGNAVALADPSTWELQFENEVFAKWFPPAKGGDSSLAARFPDLKEALARDRLKKGKSYSFESELRTGARSTCFKTTLKTLTIEGAAFTHVESVNITKQKEYEHMLDSYSDIAEQKGRQLEKANRVITAQRDRMQRELAVARDLQMSMLPRNLTPDNQDCTLYGVLNPARELGGDFFDYFFVDERRLCLMVGDVSDKGAASALFAAATKTLLKASAHRDSSSANIISRVNRDLSENNEFCMFVTLFFGILDLDSGELHYTNAGHEPPYIIRRDASWEKLSQRHGPAVGVVGDIEYSEDSQVLRTGDVLLVYTDGVTDAKSPTEGMFGKTRLESILSAHQAVTPEGITNEIVDAVHRFEGGSDQHDDVTVLAIGF